MIASFALGSFDGAGLHCVTYDFDTFGRHPEVSSQATAGLGCPCCSREFRKAAKAKIHATRSNKHPEPLSVAALGSSSGSLVTRTGYL
jgi:hypothetical protein